ncbi:hypothetical protein [Streptomyces werraensis]|uniref:hypothetical protein n=1 Tax=Streptomyces werraensis TaxID=68284 RepID=UPI0037D1BFC9
MGQQAGVDRRELCQRTLQVADASGQAVHLVPGSETVHPLFDALLASFDRHGFFGCPFVSAAVEAELDSKAHPATVAHTRRRQEWLTGLAGAAGAAQPAQLAAHLGLLIDGALASGRLLQERAVVDAAKMSARAAILAHTTRTTTA